MMTVSHSFTCAHRLISFLIVIAPLAVTSAFAQTSRKYDVELAVKEGKKSNMTDAVLTFTDQGVEVSPDKKKYSDEHKNFAYTDIKVADASYSKKPMLSVGGAVATTLLVGFIFALPFLFIKKKKHWMTVQTEKEFAVMQLGDNNWREIAAEFETHGIKVNDVKESDK
jgi:hypothetical protein